MIKLTHPQCPNPQALSKQNYKHADNKKALRDASNDKCMYCESKISHIDHAHVEHIKPKAKYPELAYEWSNLGYACPKCNINKSDTYDESCEFINPYIDNPSDYLIAIGSMLMSKKGNERAQLTINEVELNRPELLEKRISRIEEVNKAISACFNHRSELLKEKALDEIKKESDYDKEYSMFIKALLDAHEILKSTN